MLNGKFRRVFVSTSTAFLSILFLFVLIRWTDDAETCSSVKILGENKVENLVSDEERLLNDSSRQIFFLETHLDGVRSFSDPRQVCSIEAAARVDPDMDIYILLFTTEDQVNLNYTDLLSVLRSYQNIRIRFVNLEDFTQGTPMEKFFAENRVTKSQYRLEHMSDILRVLTLNKYGGLYLDLDVITLVPVRMMRKKNFVCLEGDNFFANSIMRLDREEGQKFSDAYLRKIESVYNPDSWTGIGNTLMTPTFLTFCNNTKLNVSSTSQCDSITAWARQKCFPLMYGEFRKFYEENFTDEVLTTIAQSGSFFIHIWNKMLTFGNASYVMERDSRCAYAELARVYCPKTFALAKAF